MKTKKVNLKYLTNWFYIQNILTIYVYTKGPNMYFNIKSTSRGKQSIDTNVNNLCTICCQAKPKTEFGEYELHVYDKELKRTQQAMVTYESCARCREQKKQYQEENADKQKHYKTTYKREKLQQEVDKETEQV